MSTTEAIMQKVSTLPPEKQEEVLRYVKSISELPEPPAKTGKPYSALRSFAKLKLDGPADSSTRFHEYLYGENARDSK